MDVLARAAFVVEGWEGQCRRRNLTSRFLLVLMEDE